MKLESDPACASQHPGGLTVESILVENGGLQNVFVYIKDGLGNYYFDTPTEPVKLDQKGCHYTPHVVGVRTGSRSRSSTATTRCTTCTGCRNVNQEFNFGQPFPGMKNTMTFTTPEVLMPFKCDVHRWMTPTSASSIIRTSR